MKVLFFDVGYTLVNEDAVWKARCREQAQTAEAKKLGLSATDIYHEIITTRQTGGLLLAYKAKGLKPRLKSHAFTYVQAYCSLSPAAP